MVSSDLTNERYVMKHKKILLVSCVVLLFVLTASIISVAKFSKSIKLRTATLKNSVKQILIEHEIKFLDQIQVAFAENYTAHESIINKINQRTNLLRSGPGLERSEDVSRFDQISFLVGLENDFRSVPASDICKMLNEGIAGLRSNLILSLVTSHIDKMETYDKVKTSAGKDIQLFYVPIKAIEPKVSFWPEGGNAIIYNLKGSYPCNNHIEELSRFYNNLNLMPLKYDLYRPSKLAGLFGGWHEDDLWTQCWVDEKREIVINVNLIRVGKPFFESDEVLVVILSPSSNDLEDALSYYDDLHDIESDKTVIDGRFFSFRFIN